MTGFLSNLLARARGTADVVRPRVASLFEPQPEAASGEGTISPAQPMERQEEQAPEEYPGDRTAREMPSQMRQSPAVTRPSPESVSIPEEVSEPVQTARVAVDRVAPAAPVPTRPSEPTAPLPVRLPAINPPRATVVESRNEIAHAAPAPVALGKSAARTAEHVAASRFDAPLLSLRSEKQSDDQGEIKVQRAAPPRVPTQPALPPPMRRSRFQAERREQAANPPEQVVQVTIGRVEIRATADQERRHKDRPAAAVMSLDEYLKTRAGGGRR